MCGGKGKWWYSIGGRPVTQGINEEWHVIPDSVKQWELSKPQECKKLAKEAIEEFRGENWTTKWITKKAAKG